mgnify:CR=1 FL=1
MPNTYKKSEKFDTTNHLKADHPKRRLRGHVRRVVKRGIIGTQTPAITISLTTEKNQIEGKLKDIKLPSIIKKNSNGIYVFSGGGRKRTLREAYLEEK